MAEGQGMKLASAPLRRLATGSMTGHVRKGSDGMRPGQNAPERHPCTARRSESSVTAIERSRDSFDPDMTPPHAAKGNQASL
tara:strand:- start:14145 stop:14390 length:246 start_codon:yes stop_codon:yes gene_type:complete